MPPDTQNPLIIAAYVAGLLLAVPVLIAIVRAVFFFATITTQLNDVAKGLAELVTEMREFRHEKNDQMQAVELRLALIERRHEDEDRRIGPPDRRAP